MFWLELRGELLKSAGNRRLAGNVSLPYSHILKRFIEIAAYVNCFVKQ